MTLSTTTPSASSQRTPMGKKTKNEWIAVPSRLSARSTKKKSSSSRNPAPGGQPAQTARERVTTANP